MELCWTDTNGQPQSMTVADDQARTTAAKLVCQGVAEAVEIGQTYTIMLAPAHLTERPTAARGW